MVMKKISLTTNEKKFIEAFNEKAKEAGEIAISKGWYCNEKPEDIAVKISLMHAELSEAIEGLRIGNPPSEKIPEFSQLEEEFADVILRIMNEAYQLNLRVAEAIIAKDKYNSNREYKHGNKRF